MSLPIVIQFGGNPGCKKKLLSISPFWDLSLIVNVPYCHKDGCGHKVSPKSTDPVHLYIPAEWKHIASVQKHCVYILQVAVQTVIMNWICRLGRYLLGGPQESRIEEGTSKIWEGECWGSRQCKVNGEGRQLEGFVFFFIEKLWFGNLAFFCYQARKCGP